MRILGSFTDRQYEVHLTADLEVPPQIEVRWKHVPNDRSLKRAYVALFTWDTIGGDELPAWLLAELKNHEPYLITQWSALTKE